MKKQILKLMKKDEKGFTLIELLAVIVILAIIAAIAVPLISGVINRSRNSADIATARQIYDAARLFLNQENNGDAVLERVAIHGTGTTFVAGTDTALPSVADAQAGAGLQSKGYLDVSLSMPSTKAGITNGYIDFDANGALAQVVVTMGSVSWTFDDTTVLSGQGTITKP